MLPIQMHIKKSAPTVYIKIHSDISRYLRSKKFLSTFWSSESPTSSLTSFQVIWVSPKPLVSFYTQHFAQLFFFFFYIFIFILMSPKTVQGKSQWILILWVTTGTIKFWLISIDCCSCRQNLHQKNKILWIFTLSLKFKINLH